MAQLDLLNKFNRGIIFALIDENVYEALQMYRQYSALLSSDKNNVEFAEELKKVRVNFLNGLLNFVENEKNQSKIKDLIAAYQELLSVFVNDPSLYKGCAECFEKIQQYDIQTELLEKSYSLKNDPDTLKHLIEAVKKAKDFKKALFYAKELVKIESHIANSYCVLGDIYNSLYSLDNNEENLKNAIINMEIANKMLHGEKVFLKNLTVLYTKAKDEINLKKTWDELLKYQLSNDILFNYAAYLIRHKNFKDGFKLYDIRFKKETKPTPYPVISKPEYDGKKDLSKSTLLIQWEQGIGDAFLFSRYIYDFKDKAKKIIFRVPECILKLMKDNFPFIEVVSTQKDISQIEFDYHLPLMSIPKVIDLNPDNLLRGDIYIKADKDKSEKYKKEYFNNNKFKIGFSYEGNKVGLETRNIPFEELRPLLDIENTQFYALQYMVEDKYYKGANLINLGFKINDYDDTAALMDNMDLIITTDNSVLNLAGAMGKKTFGLFNNLAEFRWFDLTGNNVKWYKSVKPYQCDKQNNWAPLIKQIGCDIKELMNENNR